MVAFVNGGFVLGTNRSEAMTRPQRRTTLVAMAEATEVKSTMWGDGTDGSACPPAETDFAKKFGQLRGTKVQTVSDTIGKFNQTFSRPVPAVYRSIVNEILTLNHLAAVCAMWRYDAVFAYGMDELFNRFFTYYPNAEEKERLIKCIVEAVPTLDLGKIRADAKDVAAFMEGKTEADLMSAIESGSSEGPVLSAINYIKTSPEFEWYYSRNFGLGLIFIMEKVGVELNDENAEKWATACNISPIKMKDEVAVYLSSLERLKQAEQMFADMAAREKKKTVERLEEAASAAQSEAEKAEQDAGESA